MGNANGGPTSGDFATALSLRNTDGHLRGREHRRADDGRASADLYQLPAFGSTNSKTNEIAFSVP
jgi:hypothetical protein